MNNLLKRISDVGMPTLMIYFLGVVTVFWNILANAFLPTVVIHVGLVFAYGLRFSYETFLYLSREKLNNGEMLIEGTTYSKLFTSHYWTFVLILAVVDIWVMIVSYSFTMLAPATLLIVSNMLSLGTKRYLKQAAL